MAPKSIDAIINNTDFAPFILNLAGIETPKYMHGRSFAAVLDNQALEDWRTASYYRYWMHRAHHDVRSHLGLRSKQYKLIYFYGVHFDNTPMQAGVNYVHNNWGREDGVIPMKTPTPPDRSSE